MASSGLASQPEVSGNSWGYAAGVSGTPTLPVGARVISIVALAGTVQGATFTIDGGDSVVVPLNRSLSVDFSIPQTDPTLVFTDTVSYMVEYTT